MWWNFAHSNHFGTSLALDYSVFSGVQLFVGAPDKQYISYALVGKVYGFLLSSEFASPGGTVASSSLRPETFFGKEIA